MRLNRFGRFTAVAAALMVPPGCAGNELGALGDILGGITNPAAGGAQQGEVLVEVQGVNAQQQAIQVRTDDGQTGAVLYDRNTVVIYRQEQYSPTALERGDIAVMQVQQIDDNRLYTPRIDVRQSVQERTGQVGTSQFGGFEQLSGQVLSVDDARGLFDLQTSDGTYTVFLSATPRPDDLKFFQLLERGERVSIEGMVVGPQRIDLRRFL